MKLKKALTLAIALTMLVTSAPIALAAHNVNDYYEFSAEELAANLETDRRVNAEAAAMVADREGISSKGYGDTIYYAVPMTLEKQINNSYCGPACVKMVDEAIRGKLGYSQDWYATQIGTSLADGSSSDQLKNALRKLTGKSYVVANVKTQNQDEVTFFNNVMDSLKKDCGVIVNIKTIPGRYTVAKGHFIAVKATEWNTTPGSITRRMTYCDPNNTSGRYGTFIIANSQMFAAVSSNAGNYVKA